MSVEIDTLRYVGVYKEPAGSYQVDNSGTPGDFVAVPYKEGTLQLQGGRAMLDPMTGKMRLDGHDRKVLGIRSCTAAFGVTLHSHGRDLDGDVAAPAAIDWPLMLMLQTILGGASATTNPGAQTVVVAGTTTTTVTVTTGHGARFALGGVIACEVAASDPRLELKEVASVAGDVVTVKEAFSATPVTGTPVRGGVTLFPAEDPDESLQLLVEGREGQDGAVYRGLQGGFTIDLPLGELGSLNFSLAGAGWARLGTSGVTIPSYSNFAPMAVTPLELHLPTVGSTTRVVVEQASLTIEPQIAYAPVKSGRAAETIARMRRQPTRPLVRGSFVCPYEDDTYYNARDARTNLALFAQVGNLAGSAILFSCPTIQIVDVQPAVADQGIAGQQVTWEARHDAAIGSTSAISYAAFRIHCV